jgi:hypothetical protein
MMADELQQFRDLFAAPRESLGVELKQWIDPSLDEGRVLIAKACIALRNNNGGVLAIGIRDDGTRDIGNEPADVRATFHFDEVQGIVTKYSSEPFEIAIHFVDYDAVEYPIMLFLPE